MNQVTTIEQTNMLSASEMRDRINKVQEVMRKVMRRDTHYGAIPGTTKPTLYKAGSEVLLTTFGIGLRLEVDDLSTKDTARYRVKAVGFHLATGQIVGEGIGECSSGEEKYKWRRAVCNEEFEATPESQRRIKFAKGRNNAIYKNEQIKTDPADYANTILKMAKKRAQIDLTLTALGASDIFTQDIEDLPQELRESVSDTSVPMGDLVEHEEMKAATNLQELAAVMRRLQPEERKSHIAYYNKRHDELKELEHA